MLDLHCHIVPGVDDGASSIEESLEMARMLVDDGVTHVAATPHFNRSMRVKRGQVLRGVGELNQELARSGIPLEVLPGSEVQVIDTREYRRQLEAREFCHLADGEDYTLLEFSWNSAQYPNDAPDLLRWLVERGTTPIIAHPERQDWSTEDPERLNAMTEAGAWLQINVDSLLGFNGDDARSSAEELIRRFSDVVLATDAHNRHRCSGLTPGLDWVRAKVGAKRADDLAARIDRVLETLASAR
jgi:protein-tyrosine phosphatase